MSFTKTILEAFKYWVEKKFSKVENDLANKQPIGDYALRNEIPVTSVNGQIGDVIIGIPDIPVTSVNGQTGDVMIETNDITLDATLSIEGQAADAKAVGDALARKSQVQIITWEADD